MSDHTVFRLYRPGDEAEIVELLSSVFKGWPHFDLECSQLDHWRWKYTDLYTDTKFITVAERDGRIVACDHTIVQRMMVRGECISSGTSADVAVHPDNRSQRVYTTLRELKFSEQKAHGPRFHLDVSYNPALIKQNIRMGNPQFPFDVVNYFRIRDLNLHLSKRPKENSILRRYGYRTLSTLNKVAKLIDGSQLKESSSIEIRRISRFPREVNTFWNRIRTNYNLILEKTGEYLNHRYCNRAGGNYVTYLALLDEDILGYIVLRINQIDPEYHTGHVVDLLTLPEHMNATEALLSRAMNFFDENDVNVVTYFGLKGNKFDQHLRRQGLLPSATLFRLFYKPYNDMESSMRTISESPKERIHLSSGNFDSI